jgi:hypothetical protein
MPGTFGARGGFTPKRKKTAVARTRPVALHAPIARSAWTHALRVALEQRPRIEQQRVVLHAREYRRFAASQRGRELAGRQARVHDAHREGRQVYARRAAAARLRLFRDHFGAQTAQLGDASRELVGERPQLVRARHGACGARAVRRRGPRGRARASARAPRS